MTDTVAMPSDEKAAVAAEPTGLSVAEVAGMAPSAAFARLEPQRQDAALALMDWVNNPRLRQQAATPIVAELCDRLVAAGMPLDRYSSSTVMMTADHDAFGRIWFRGRAVKEIVYVSPDKEDDDYLRSPLKAAADSGTWLELWLADTPDDRFGVVPEFKAEGLVHYVCVPMWLTNGANGWITFATRWATGFATQDLLLIAFIAPLLMMRIDGRVGWMTLDKLLRTYVGDEPHQAILAGHAKRGQVTAITAAMLVADLRNSTGHVVRLGAIPAVELFNRLFDCLVPGIEEHRGEVLKYMGDGLLAIFREEYMGPPAADRALAAAAAAFEAIARVNASRPDDMPMQIGIALHYGEVAYGNVGSGSRLDFTVIGPDVALASRIAGMNGPLGRPLLMSGSLAERLHTSVSLVGRFPARGFADPIDVYALAS